MSAADWKPCDYCGSPTPGHREHSEPRAHGGSDLAVNIAHACSYCNYEKADRTLDQWAADRVRVGLSWPPMGRAAFHDGMWQASLYLDDEDGEAMADRILELGPTVLDLYRAARRSPAFTFEAANQDLLAALKRLLPAA